MKSQAGKFAEVRSGVLTAVDAVDLGELVRLSLRFLTSFARTAIMSLILLLLDSRIHKDTRLLEL